MSSDVFDFLTFIVFPRYWPADVLLSWACLQGWPQIHANESAPGSSRVLEIRRQSALAIAGYDRPLATKGRLDRRSI
jgi:hypothetical protein